MEEGRSSTAKVIGSKKKYRSRSTSGSSQDSLSSRSYSGGSDVSLGPSKTFLPRGPI